MILRELIARFGFDVDEKGADQVDKRIDGMKKGIGGLGKLLGVTLAGAGAKAFFTIGQRAERAQFNLERFAGTNFENLRDEFKRIQEEIDKTREGASKIITERQFDVAAANFLKVFGKGEKQIQAFGKIFEFSAKQAIITGQEVTDIIAEIQGGIEGGGFDAFLDLPGFDIFRKQFLEFQQAAIDPGDPGGKIALQNRLNAVIGIVTESATDQAEALQAIPKELLEVDKASAQTKDTLEELGKTVNNLLVPAFKGFNVVLGRFNELIEIGQGQETAGGAFKAIINELRSPAERPQPITPLGNAPATFPGLAGAGASGDSIQVVNNITIENAVDAKAVGQEVISVFQGTINNAKRSIVKTEE